jgi:hypothetical protein
MPTSSQHQLYTIFATKNQKDHSCLRGGRQSRDRASCSMSIPATHMGDDETKAEGISPSRMFSHSHLRYHCSSVAIHTPPPVFQYAQHVSFRGSVVHFGILPLFVLTTILEIGFPKTVNLTQPRQHHKCSITSRLDLMKRCSIDATSNAPGSRV